MRGVVGYMGGGTEAHVRTLGYMGGGGNGGVLEYMGGVLGHMGEYWGTWREYCHG